MFHETLEARIRTVNSCLCVGLDIDWREMSSYSSASQGLIEFVQTLVRHTSKHACAYKLNHAFFAAQGLEHDLAQLITNFKVSHPSIPVILDAKRGDIGNTAERYAEEAFVRYNADAVTVNPYLGWDSIEPFLQYHDRGVILLCRTSNAGSAWIQETGIEPPVYLKIAKRVHREGNPNIMLVLGATHLEALSQVRRVAPTTTMLVPGIGAQGGDLTEVLKRSRRSDGLGVIVNCSRSIVAQQNTDDYFSRVTESAARYARLMSIR